MSARQPNNPLHGITLEMMLRQMVDRFGWEGLARDLSIAVAPETTAEELGDRVRAALGDRADAVEAIEVLTETPGEGLPPQATERLGLVECVARSCSVVFSTE